MKKLLLFLLGILVIAWGYRVQAQTMKGAPEKAEVMQSCSKEEMDLRQNMRKLWEDHVVYTRSYVTSALAGLEDQDTVAERLLKNQEEIGNAINPYYGEGAGKNLASLLKDHIMIATEVVKAVKEKNKENLDSSNKRWRENGNDIASFLSGANANWKKEDLVGMMDTHLNLLTDQVMARDKKDWGADIEAYDKGHGHILMFADALSDGIVKQFPDKFKK